VPRYRQTTAGPNLFGSVPIRKVMKLEIGKAADFDRPATREEAFAEKRALV
jgi:hypothetical protein